MPTGFFYLVGISREKLGYRVWWARAGTDTGVDEDKTYYTDDAKDAVETMINDAQEATSQGVKVILSGDRTTRSLVNSSGYGEYYG
jgi:ABC-type sugar transport system substrate-binding protein